MAKCFNCGKNFDYEKYYGICPKCGSYNQENIPEETHQALHEQYDSVKQQRNHFETESRGYGTEMPQSGGCAGEQSGYQSGQNVYYDGYNTGYKKPARAKATAGTVVVFVLLIVGIIGTIIFPILYTVGKSFQLGGKLVRDFANSDFYEEPYEDLYGYEEDFEREKQTADTVTVNPGEPCALGLKGELSVTVKDARVRVPADYVGDFPKGQDLVAISVAYEDNHASYKDYAALELLYVGYGDGGFRECLSSYDMEPYLHMLRNISIVDAYSMNYGSGEGELLVFVPAGTSSLDLYLESRNEDNYEVLSIYQIALDIKPGEEI